jgi:hypothetical protein
MTYFSAIGPVRGACGHKHQSEAAAEACIAADQRACARQGGYSDRVAVERRPRFDAGAFVHEHDGRYVVAQRDGARYTAPLRRADARLTGAGAVFGSLNYVAGSRSYATRAAAIRVARAVYGAAW